MESVRPLARRIFALYNRHPIPQLVQAKVFLRESPDKLSFG